MASEGQVRMFNSLPAGLVGDAVDLSESARSREYCFPIRDARQILGSLLGGGLVLLGGDLWVKEGNEYFATGEGWHVDSVDRELPSDRAQRIRLAAERFFGLHEGSDDKWVTFVVKS